MSETKKYTAGDIERYHNGQLTAGEMNAIEKAALDDPFLAEAMEGYKLGSNPQADLAELNQRLAERTGTVRRNRGRLVDMPWFRAAAMIMFLAGAGLLVYQFAFNKSSEEIAKAPTESFDDVAKDSIIVSGSTGTVTKDSAAGSFSDEKIKSGNIENTSANKGKNNFDAALQSDVTITEQQTPVATQIPAATKIEDNKPSDKNLVNLAEKRSEKLSDLRDEGKKKESPQVVTANKDYERYDNMGVYSKSKSGPMRQQQANNFRGRVLDPNNNPIPFANILNTQDRRATYADANGYFNLISADSVVDVQVRSVGFEINNARLRDVQDNKVVLKDDPNPVSAVVLNTARTNTTRRAQFLEQESEEPVPADGWENYDAYLVNNIQMPEDLKTRKVTGEVEVSFEVDKHGNPVNLRIEKSLCGKCDEEAKRLIKQGPKWERKAKKRRTVVTIPFTNYQP